MSRLNNGLRAGPFLSLASLGAQGLLRLVPHQSSWLDGWQSKASPEPQGSKLALSLRGQPGQVLPKGQSESQLLHCHGQWQCGDPVQRQGEGGRLQGRILARGLSQQGTKTFTRVFTPKQIRLAS